MTSLDRPDFAVIPTPESIHNNLKVMTAIQEMVHTALYMAIKKDFENVQMWSDVLDEWRPFADYCTDVLNHMMVIASTLSSPYHDNKFKEELKTKLSFLKVDIHKVVTMWLIWDDGQSSDMDVINEEIARYKAMKEHVAQMHVERLTSLKLSYENVMERVKGVMKEQGFPVPPPAGTNSPGGDA